MKAVVIEINGNKAVTLSEDGMVNMVKDNGYKIGESVEMEVMKVKGFKGKSSKMIASLAASMVILLGGGTAFAYNTPVAQVSVDVNPSIVYSINMFDKVIDAEMANEDAEIILDTIEWDGEKLSVVVEKTIEALKDKDYLDTDNWYEDSITIGVNSNSEDRETRLIEAIKDELENIIFEESNEEVDLDANEDIVVGIGAERVAEAERLSAELGIKVTPGKLNLVEKLGASYENTGENPINTDEEIGEWLDKPVKQIMAQIKTNNRIGKPEYTTPSGIQKKNMNSIEEDENDDEDQELDEDLTTEGGVNNPNENGMKNKEKNKNNN